MFQLTGFADEASTDLLEQLNVITELGMNHLELRGLWGKNILELTDEEAERANALIKQHSCKVSSIASPLGKYSIIDDFKPQLAAAKRAIELAQLFQTPFIRVFSYYIPEGSDPADYKQEVIRRMTELAALAEAGNVTLVLENDGGGLYAGTDERCLELLQAVSSPALKLAFDPGNFVLSGVRPFDEAYRKLEAYVAYVHIKDASADKGMFVPAGAGDAQIAELLDVLSRKETNLFLSVEPHLHKAHPEATDPERFGIAVKALKALLDNREPAEQQRLKVGLVGLGNIGRTHISILRQMPNVQLVGVCDQDRERAEQFAEMTGAQAYSNHSDMLERSGLEAVIIAVPHFDHKIVALDAFKRGIHVLCEKPLAVHVKDAAETIDAYEAAKQRFPHLVFGMMFQERTLPFYKKIKELVDSGELGRLMRTTWINTAWFRSQAYYDSGSWRATWAGEGGGILTNQCPHNLDFYQWVFGVPDRISGHASIGKYHRIEVEDEVTAYFEHDNGMIGHFIVTTAESPGTNRMEIVGENGRLVYENDKLTLYRNRISVLEHLARTKEGFQNVEWDAHEIEVDIQQPAGHAVVTGKFVQSILSGCEDLIAHGTEGINSLQLANGIMMSSFTKQMVTVPIDGDAFEEKLRELIERSTFVKQEAAASN
ncbi:Gfo/Idh/MocA family oxidoreductase [Paenibacillus solisilvae]|uniref:Gfo/Idh/MocA family oxidoreductase n=1 Tax=Paenibacillus solisilvae TaxID=2486751 RepID=A0ABW0VTI7_9BACL